MRSDYHGGIFGHFDVLIRAPGEWLGDVPPQEGDGVGQIRKTEQVIDSK